MRVKTLSDRAIQITGMAIQVAIVIGIWILVLIRKGELTWGGGLLAEDRAGMPVLRY